MTLIHWIVSVVAILIAAYIVPGVQVTILTLGLFSLVINALLVMLADLLVPDFSIGGFWIAVLFSIVVSVVNGFFHIIIRKGE